MAARARGVTNHMIGIGDLPQRAAFKTRLPAARLARTVAQTAANSRLLPQPALEGGCEMFELSRPNRRRRSAISARSAAISARRDAANASISAGRTIPPLIHSLEPPSQKVRRPKPISATLWHSRLTPRWELHAEENCPASL